MSYKATTTHASVPLIDGEDQAVDWLADKLGVPRAGVLRVALVELVDKYDHAKAKSLIRERMEHAAKVAAKCAIVLPLIWTFMVRAIDDSFARARRGSRNGRRDDACEVQLTPEIEREVL